MSALAYVNRRLVLLEHPGISVLDCSFLLAGGIYAMTRELNGRLL